MRRQTIVQTILVILMFSLSVAIFLFFAWRGRFWWGIGAAIISYLLLFWLAIPYLARREKSSTYHSTPIHPNSTSKKTVPSPMPSTSVTDSPSTVKIGMPPAEIWLAEVIDENGGAVYGHARRYVSDLYYGRVSHGAVVQLLEETPALSEYELPIIKVRVLHDPDRGITNFGTAVWLGLEQTSLQPYYQPTQTPILSSEGRQRETDRLYRYHEQYKPPEFIQQPPSFPKGMVIAEHGSTLYEDEHGSPNAYLTRLSTGTKLFLREEKVHHNQYKLPIILVEVTASQYAEDVGLVGWLMLTDTTFGDYYDVDEARLSA